MIEEWIDHLEAEVKAKVASIDTAIAAVERDLDEQERNGTRERAQRLGEALSRLIALRRSLAMPAAAEIKGRPKTRRGDRLSPSFTALSLPEALHAKPTVK